MKENSRNKEEKKALKVMNARTKRLLDELEIEKEDMIDEPRIAYLMQEIRANKTILNLIEKLQKENEELKSVKKECVFREDGTEECLWHCSNCNKEWLFYEGTPEDNELKYCPHCGAKVTKYENYIEGEIEIANKMEEDLIEKLQKENELLKKDNEELRDKYATFVKMSSEVIANSVPTQKVKDKIEKLEQQENIRTLDFCKTTQDIRNIIIQELQELLEGRK